MAVAPPFINALLYTFMNTAPAPVFKAILVDSSYVPGATSEGGGEQGTDVAATHAIPDVARPTLSNVAIFTNPDGENALTCDPITFAALADGVADVGGLVIYVEGSGAETDNLMVASDVDDGPFDPPAGDLIYDIDPSGFVVFTG